MENGKFKNLAIVSATLAGILIAGCSSRQGQTGGRRSESRGASSDSAYVPGGTGMGADGTVGGSRGPEDSASTGIDTGTGMGTGTGPGTGTGGSGYDTTRIDSGSGTGMGSGAGMGGSGYDTTRTDTTSGSGTDMGTGTGTGGSGSGTGSGSGGSGGTGSGGSGSGY